MIAGARKLRRFATAEASPDLLAQVRSLMDDAFRGEFTEEDWQHTIGGTHFVVELEGAVASHASVIERTIEVDGRGFRTGYVEGVATASALQGQGLGSLVMQAASHLVRSSFELGALGTDRHSFYERLGWERWRGPSYVRRAGDLVRSAEEDDGLMVLRFGPSAHVPLTAPIACRERPGDDW